MKILNLPKKIFNWCTRTRLRKLLSSILTLLIVLTSIKFIVVKPKEVKADSYLKFDEGYGNTTKDVQNGASGSITNAVWKTDDLCVSGRCLYFDGSGDYVSLGDDSDFDFTGSAQFTITGWFRHPEISTNPDYLITKHQTSTAGGYKIYMDSDGDLVFGIDDDGTWDTTDIIGDDQSKNFDDYKWHHFAAVKNGTSGIYLYVDGQLIDSDTSLTETGSLVNAANLYVGIDADGTSNSWSGYVDEVKIYTTSAKTSAEVKADLVIDSTESGASAVIGQKNQVSFSDGLVGYWRMNDLGIDAEGEAITDSSGNGNSGTLYGDNSSEDNGTGMNCADPLGKFFSGCTFDGIDDYVSVADSSSLDLTQGLTISAWVKSNNSTTTERLVSKSDNGDNGYEFVVNIDETISFGINTWSGDENLYITSTQTIAVSGWSHVVATYDGKNLSVYINGVQKTEPTTATAIIANNNPLIIGDREIGARPFDGTIDELRIFNRSLSPSEINSLYLWAEGPYTHWRLDESSGTVAYDVSGNAINGNWVSPAGSNQSWKPGKTGNSYSNTGSDGYIQLTNSASMKGVADFTVEAWVYVNTLPPSGNRDYFYNETSSDNVNFGRISLGVFNASSCSGVVWGGYIRNEGSTMTVCGTSTVTTNKWYHLAYVYNSSTDIHKLYVNGVTEDIDTSSRNPFDTSDPLLIPAIGNWSSSSAMNLVGLIDEVKIYRYERSSEQIAQDMGASNLSDSNPIGEPISYWKMDEGGGTTSYDSMPAAHNLTHSAASWSQNGKMGNAFNAIGSVWLYMLDDSELDFNQYNNFSISLWIKTTNASNPGAGEYIVNKQAGTGYAIYTDTNGYINFGIDSDGTWSPADVATYSTSIYDQAWHHIVAVKTGVSKIEIYVDGILRGSDSTIAATSSLENNQNFRIGDQAGNDNGDEFNGLIDEVKIYRFALTQDQVKTETSGGYSQVFGTLGTDASGNPSNSNNRLYCPPGDTTASCSPIGEWKLDDNTGTNANDSSGNGYNGTLTSGPLWTTGKFGSGVVFDPAQSQYISTADIDINGSFSLESWVYPVATTVSKTIISKGTGTATNYALDLRNNDNSIGFFVYDNGGTVRGLSTATTEKVSINQWSHIIGVYNASSTPNFTIYLNGKRVTETADWTGTMNSNDTQTVLGARGLGSSYTFNGKIDNLRIFNYALTPAQIAWNYNKGKPIVHYKFDECTGSTANNAAPSASGADAGYDATIYPQSLGNTAVGDCTTSATTMWYNGRVGKYTSSLDFDGSDDYAEISSAAILAPSGVNYTNLSWGGWFYPSTDPTSMVLINKESEFTMRTDASNFPECNVAASISYATSTVALTANAWNHVLCTYDGSNVKIYLNGILTDSQVETGLISSASTVTEIARNPGGGGTQYFDGKIDEVKIWNYPLTSQQIKTEYSHGAVSF